MQSSEPQSFIVFSTLIQEANGQIGAFGLTEPDAGSDPASMKTTAVKKGDVYILNGSKTWISNSPVAGLFVIWAKLDGKICGFVVPRTEGLQTPKIEGKFSLRARYTATTACLRVASRA
jgi:glutaryl-CoA dehydrogenase